MNSVFAFGSMETPKNRQSNFPVLAYKFGKFVYLVKIHRRITTGSFLFISDRLKLVGTNLGKADFKL